MKHRSKVFWPNVKKEIETTTDGCLTFDDTVRNQIYSQKIDSGTSLKEVLVRRKSNSD
ncbi:MAG: hypothetical protein MGG11_14675 [Trichodesmium sp. MAG_R03]|nr:hypothetical protein [Trichodesmium sp. MAG_R03]